jgi:hypothetical protein
MSDIVEIKTTEGGTSWINKKEYDLRKDFERNHRRRQLNGWYDLEKSKSRREGRGQTNLKYAYVTVGATRKMVMMNPDNMIAYKMDGYVTTWMVWKKFKLERWCRPMDL